MREALQDIDLSSERATARSDLRIELSPKGYVSSIGNAMIFVGRARRYAEALHVDVDAVVRLLREQGVGDDYMKTLAVVAHDKTELSGLLSHARGWHSNSQGLTIESPVDDEKINFTNALHLVGSYRTDVNHTLLHEAGHLHAHYMGNPGEILYTPKNIRRLRALGLGGLAFAFASMGVAAGLASDYPAIGLGTLGAAAGLVPASAVAAVQPRALLWRLSSAEKIADAFADEHHERNLVSNEPVSGVNRLMVASDHVRYEYLLNKVVSR